MTKYEYDGKEIINDKLPYDSVAINKWFTDKGIKVSKTRTGGILYLDTDKELTTAQKDTLKIYLTKYDVNKTKNIHEEK